MPSRIWEFILPFPMDLDMQAECTCSEIAETTGQDWINPLCLHQRNPQKTRNDHMTASPGSLHRNYLHVPDWDAWQNLDFVWQPCSPVELGVDQINPVHGVCSNTYPPGQTGPVLNTYLHRPKNLFTKETGTAPKASARAPLCCKSKKQKMLRHQRSQQAQPPRLCLHTIPAVLFRLEKTWKAFSPTATNTWGCFVACQSLLSGTTSICWGFF